MVSFLLELTGICNSGHLCQSLAMLFCLAELRLNTKLCITMVRVFS